MAVGKVDKFVLRIGAYGVQGAVSVSKYRKNTVAVTVYGFVVLPYAVAFAAHTQSLVRNVKIMLGNVVIFDNIV